MNLALAALVLTAVSVEALKPPPIYSVYADQYHQASQTALSLLPHPPLDGMSPNSHIKANNAGLHYGLFVSVLLNLAKNLSEPNAPSYSKYYLDAVKDGIEYAWADPLAVTADYKDTLHKTNYFLRSVLDLIKNCQKKQERSCDYDVQKAVESDPKKYDVAAKLLVMVGELSHMYLSNTYEEEAKEHNTVKMLVEGQEELQPLVERVVEVHKFIKQYPQPVDG